MRNPFVEIRTGRSVEKGEGREKGGRREGEGGRRET
jgi:hypothetical protein